MEFGGGRDLNAEDGSDEEELGMDAPHDTPQTRAKAAKVRAAMLDEESKVQMWKYAEEASTLVCSVHEQMFAPFATAVQARGAPSPPSLLRSPARRTPESPQRFLLALCSSAPRGCGVQPRAGCCTHLAWGGRAGGHFFFFFF